MKPQPTKSETGAGADNAAWRKFPQLERLAESGELPEMLERIERTCRQLDNLAQSDSEEIARRARSALAAYGRTIELIHELDAERRKMAEPK